MSKHIANFGSSQPVIPAEELYLNKSISYVDSKMDEEIKEMTGFNSLM
jgi:hypothetical protein